MSIQNYDFGYWKLNKNNNISSFKQKDLTLEFILGLVWYWVGLFM